jgi:hypothetical protein
VNLDISQELDDAAIALAMKNVKISMEAWIDHEISSSSRTQDLLHGRLEMDSESHKLVKKSLNFHHYLRTDTDDSVQS